jgi:hypothetical protein
MRVHQHSNAGGSGDFGSQHTGEGHSISELVPSELTVGGHRFRTKGSQKTIRVTFEPDRV